MAEASKISRPIGQKPEHDFTAASGYEDSLNLVREGDRSSLRSAGGSSGVGLASGDLPLSFGEQLVLETYLRCRRRPYDRQRQDALAQPRRSALPGEAWGTKGCVGSMTLAGEASSSSSSTVASRQQVASIVNRLSQPRRPPTGAVSTGEQIAIKSQERSTPRRRDVDVETVLQRLASPRAIRSSAPTPGERVLLLHDSASPGRKVDLEHLNRMAQPTRRGASCRAWVRLEWLRSAETPRTARSADDAGGSAHTADGSLGGGLRTAGGLITGGRLGPTQPATSSSPSANEDADLDVASAS